MDVRHISILLIAVLLYGAAINHLKNIPRTGVVREMQVALPRFVQVGLAGGDRYLAANINGFRALVASTDRMQADNFKIQGRVQQDVAWLNPAHEDNYYIAAAILPWNGEVDAAQDVLQRAIVARPFDWQPIFYYAFNLYHFKRDPIAAAQWLLKASSRATDQNDRFAIENVAARWFEKGYEPRVAIGVIEGMANQSREGGFKRYLQTRAARLRSLETLRQAAVKYQSNTGRPLRDLQELVNAGLIRALPVDPFGFGFAVNNEGQPILLNAPLRKPQ